MHLLNTCQDIVAHAQLSRAIKKEKKKVQVGRERHVLNFFLIFFWFQKKRKEKGRNDVAWRVVRTRCVGKPVCFDSRLIKTVG